MIRSSQAGRAIVIAGAVIATSGLVGAFLFGEAVLDRMIDTGSALDTRTDLYRQVIDLIFMRPWTGFGGGAFELAFPIVHRAPVPFDSVWDKAHNTYLTLWAELGLIFGTIPMVILMLVTWKLLRSLMHSRRDWMSQTVALAVIVAGAVHSLVDFSLEIQANTFMFIALIAAGLSAAHTTDRG